MVYRSTAKVAAKDLADELEELRPRRQDAVRPPGATRRATRCACARSSTV